MSEFFFFLRMFFSIFFSVKHTIGHIIGMVRLIDMNKQGKSEGFESCDRPIVRKRPIRVKSGDVLSRVTLKFDG